MCFFLSIKLINVKKSVYSILFACKLSSDIIRNQQINILTGYAVPCGLVRPWWWKIHLRGSVPLEKGAHALVVMW